MDNIKISPLDVRYANYDWVLFLAASGAGNSNKRGFGQGHEATGCGGFLFDRRENTRVYIGAMANCSTPREAIAFAVDAILEGRAAIEGKALLLVTDDVGLVSSIKVWAPGWREKGEANTPAREAFVRLNFAIDTGRFNVIVGSDGELPLFRAAKREAAIEKTHAVEAKRSGIEDGSGTWDERRVGLQGTMKWQHIKPGEAWPRP